MTIHTGSVYHEGEIAIGPADFVLIRDASKANDVVDTAHWLSDAVDQDDIYYFAIYQQDRLIGQIFLHDINRTTGEALIGYHLFDVEDRGRGLGTKALCLLKQFVVAETNLTRLVIITSSDNIASQRIAQKCRFIYAGPAREGPSLLVFICEIRKDYEKNRS